MPEAPSNPPGSVRAEFLGLVRDLSQFLERQKLLGNTDIRVSRESLGIVENWGKPKRQKPVPESVSEHQAEFRPDRTPPRPGFKSLGPETARVWFVDSDGTFFTGEPGQLLTKILAAMTLSPQSVFICNTADPAGLRAGLGRSRPAAVVALGEQAARLLIQTREPLAAFRGRWHGVEGVPIMPTFHPRQLLADISLKRPVWEDMQQVMKKAGLGS